MYSAIIESWTLALEKRDAAWSVAGLDVTGTMTRLYKIRIPSGRAVRARRVEISHVDVRFTFTDAAVFYDNLPDVETALVVVGRGRVAFTPGDANEKHQLDLLYKKDRIEDDVESVFVRCSVELLRLQSSTIETDEGGAAVSAAERDKAAAVVRPELPPLVHDRELDRRRASCRSCPRATRPSSNSRRRKVGEMAYIYSPFSDDEVSLYDHGKERTVCLYSPEEQSPPSSGCSVSFAEKFDVSSLRARPQPHPGLVLSLGQGPHRGRPQGGPLDSLKFRFNPDLEILKITDDEGRELFYTVDKVRKILYVYFVSPAASGDPTSIEVFYRGRMVPAAPTTDVISQLGLNDKIRVRPRYETSFYTQAGFWYPGPAEEDYFPARLTLIVPPEFKCVANGELVAQGRREDMDDVAALEKAGNAVYTFVSRSPVKYLSFIVGKFDLGKERPGPVPVSTYVSSEIMDSQPDLVDQAADILDFYAGAFGPYPYEKLGIVLRLWPVFGGHSPASFIVLNEVPWLGEGFPAPVDTPVDLSNWEEYFLAHEIAHQWWGQGVSFDSYKDQWLSEGLAQFAAASYLRHKYGEGAYAAILKKFSRWTEKKSFRGPVVMGSRLSYFDFAAYQAIVYDKAALALFMLQDLVGREAFEAGLRSFFETHKFRAARTSEFIAAMEAASGRDLKAFFRGWLYSWELPDVRTTWTETPVAEGVRIDFRVTQVKGRFVFPLWVEWSRKGASGRTLIVVDEATETASLILPGRPDRIRVNPDKAVPGKFD